MFNSRRVNFSLGTFVVHAFRLIEDTWEGAKRDHSSCYADTFKIKSERVARNVLARFVVLHRLEA